MIQTVAGLKSGNPMGAAMLLAGLLGRVSPTENQCAHSVVSLEAPRRLGILEIKELGCGKPFFGLLNVQFIILLM